MENDRIAIVGGVRTPFAKAFTTQELIQRLDLPPEAIDEVIWGAVLPTMTNLNVGREVAIALGLDHAPGFTLARQCATGIQSITSAAERIIGMHFFSPVEKMPLLEIITSSYSSEQTLATAVALGRKLGKTVIVVKDSPGFFVNRILTPHLNEAFKLLEDGIAVDELDRAARRVGFPVGPCTLLDEVGLDVAGKVSGVMDSFIGERLEMADHNRLFTEDNRLGRKNGRGFYAYENGKKGKVDDTVYRLLDNPRRRSWLIGPRRGRGTMPFPEVPFKVWPLTLTVPKW